MSKTQQDDAARDDRVLLGRRCVTVHHGTLWVDERIAGILGLRENQVLPEPVVEDEDEAPAEDARPAEEASKQPQIVLTPIMRVSPSRKGLYRIAAVLALFLVVWGVQARRLWSRTEASPVAIAVPAPVEQRPKQPTPALAVTTVPVRVQRGADGDPVEISAAHPERVLASFCSLADPALARTPLGTGPASPPDPNLVVGRFEDRGAGGAPREILIYLDPRSSRWVTRPAP